MNAKPKPATDGVQAGKMFGYPAYYVGGTISEVSRVGIKRQADLASRLVAEGRGAPFQPFGKPRMKEWIRIDRDCSADSSRDTEIFAASVRYVYALATGKEGKR